MPRRERLSPVQRTALVGIPTDLDGLAFHYMLGTDERALFAGKRGARNRLGLSVSTSPRNCSASRRPRIRSRVPPNFLRTRLARCCLM